MGRRENRYFDAWPRVIPAGRETEINIRPLFDHCRFPAAVDFRLAVVPLDGAAGQTGKMDAEPTPFTMVEGSLRFIFRFADEGEYAVLLKNISDKTNIRTTEIRLYALERDLFCRKPFKGDLHMHSSYSDGGESPAYVAAACRRIGLDWMAVTDHHRYEPSGEAIRALEGVAADLRVYPGEEVHPPDNPVHIINFGGKFGVNALFKTDAYRAEVKAIEDGLADWPAGLGRGAYASCQWCFNKIRQAGGLGVFCHPYWLTNNRYDVPAALTDVLFERRPFDALELIGGYYRHELESNHLQVARYYEECARGGKIPVVGASDAHGCERGELFGWYYTVAFSPSSDLPDLIRSIKDFYSVAVESLPGQTPRAFGPFRLVKYVQFLVREIFPQHDELCVEEGRLMLAHVAGDASAAGKISQCRGRTAALYDRFWGG